MQLSLTLLWGGWILLLLTAMIATAVVSMALWFPGQSTALVGRAVAVSARRRALTWWGSPAIAHTMVSFGCSDGEHILFSLGIRPERGEAYSSVAGFFKSYERS